MNNLVSYCGLVDARISASEKDLLLLTARKQFANFIQKVKFVLNIFFFAIGLKWFTKQNTFLVVTRGFSYKIPLEQKAFINIETVSYSRKLIWITYGKIHKASSTE